MMRRTHRFAAMLAAATTAFGGAAAAAADPAPSDPQPKPSPVANSSSPSCAALAEPAGDLDGLKDKLFNLAGNASNTTKNGLDIGSLISLYGQSQDILRSLREESGKLRGAADEVSEPDLHDSTLSLADTLDEGASFAEQITNPAAPKPSGDNLSSKVGDLSTHTANSLQRFGDSYQKTCGVDLGLGNLSALAKNLGGVNPAQQAPAPAAPSQQAPAPVAPSSEAPPAPAPASNKSLLAPAPIK